MYRDAVATVLAHEWDLGAEMFDGITAKGPVPVLYAANPAEARIQLDSDPSRAHRDLQRIYARMAVAENLPHNLAFDYILSPRY
jgi:hypothetical protein